ncbi:MAG: M10 family metallopeptidase C-terminal domain-containing protein, partial [Gammaproteobacteria bacterium]
GGAGNDTIFGGDGNDNLAGGAGRDVFAFNSVLDAATNVDAISDFDVSDDVIALSEEIFSKLSVEESGWFGNWASENFRVGGATDPNDYILYDSATGALYYDADANGLGTAVKFATLSPGLQLSDANFRVYASDADLIGG